jgi:carboxyl-terminal processing protease
VQYTGPLVVLVNEFSASASEIFAAAIQDYSRGVIIGSSSTYGKGTVQRSIGLDSENGFSLSNADLGSVKLTMQKFYRINGGSTQLNGVSSDIVLPDNLEYLKVREKDNTDALPWDQVARANFTSWSAGYDLQKIKQLSEKRLQADSSFNLISQKSKWLYEQSEKPYSLSLKKFKEEQIKIRTTIKELESLLSLKNQMQVSPLPTETNKWAQDSAKQLRFNKWISDLKKDIYINQGVKVINDIINQQGTASSPKAPVVSPVKKGF